MAAQKGAYNNRLCPRHQLLRDAHDFEVFREILILLTEVRQLDDHGVAFRVIWVVVQGIIALALAGVLVVDLKHFATAMHQKFSLSASLADGLAHSALA